MPASPFKRAGLHRLSCDCGGYVYATVAQLESRGLPACWCGEAFQPERLELALLLGLEDSPIVRAYEAKVSSVARGQAWTGRNASTLESPEFRALHGNDREAGILEQQREIARARRLAAIGLIEREESDPDNPRRKIRVRYRLNPEPIPF